MTARSPHSYPATWTLGMLADEHAGRCMMLTAHRHVEPLPAEEVRGHALEVLALAQRIATEALASRWVYATDALAAGASVAEVSTATGLEEFEVRQGLGRWADGQVRHGFMTPARRAEVLALVAEAVSRDE